MASAPPPPNYPGGGGYGQPPPYQAGGYGPPPQQKVIVQPQKTVIVQQKGGFLSGVMRDVEKAGNELGRDIDRLVDGRQTGPILQNFNTGNVLALISRSSGHCLQIVQSATGQLVVDGNGMDSPQSYNTHWTVTNLGNNIVRLHNNNNYLVIANGNTCLLYLPPGTEPGAETKFRVTIRDYNFVTLESIKELGRHIGILPNGQLKAAMATGKEMHAHFGIRLVYTPYQTPTVAPTQPVKR